MTTSIFIPDLSILDEEPTLASVSSEAVAEEGATAEAPPPPIPPLWDEQRAALQVLDLEQQQAISSALKQAEGAGPVTINLVAVLDGLPRITERHFEALEKQPVSADDLAHLAVAARGKYQSGDTRGFVRQQEDTCAQCNCWMVRNPDGSPQYLSEPPASSTSTTNTTPLGIKTVA